MTLLFNAGYDLLYFVCLEPLSYSSRGKWFISKEVWWYIWGCWLESSSTSANLPISSTQPLAFSLAGKGKQGPHSWVWMFGIWIRSNFSPLTSQWCLWLFILKTIKHRKLKDLHSEYLYISYRDSVMKNESLPPLLSFPQTIWKPVADIVALTPAHFPVTLLRIRLVSYKNRNTVRTGTQEHNSMELGG